MVMNKEEAQRLRKIWHIKNPAAYDWVICKNPKCRILFPRIKPNKSHRSHAASVRSANSVTCRSLCSKQYGRSYVQIKAKEKLDKIELSAALALANH